MGIRLVFYFILQLPWLIQPATSEASRASTCEEICGDVPLPFPFGIEPGCYNSSWFSVTCNETVNGPKPFISRINLELLGKFWPDDNVITVNNPVTYLNCGDKGNNGTTSSVSVNLTGTPFFFSSKFNDFGSVGCGNLVFVSRNIRSEPILGSCLQQRCGELTTKLSGCQDIIKENLTSYTASMVEVINPGSKRCTSAFMFDSSQLKSSDLDPQFPYNISIDTTHVPATLQWKPITCDLEAELCLEVEQAERRRYTPPLVQSPALPLPYEGGCDERCGNVEIPFPFGIKVGCYMNNAFRVTCNETINGPTPFISSINLRLLQVSFYESVALINNPITHFRCLNEDQTNVVRLNLTGTPFLFSDVFNRFVSFGCGCATFLSNSTNDNPDHGYCLLSRCGTNVAAKLSCSSGIPSGLSSFAVTVTPIYPSNGNNQSCGSAFVVDERYIDSLGKTIPYRNGTSNWTLLNVPTTLQWGTHVRGLCELIEGSNIFCRSDGEYCWTSLSQTHLCVCTSDPYVDSDDVCQEAGKCQDLKYKYCYMLCFNAPGNNCLSSCPVGYEYIQDMCKPVSPSIVAKEPKRSHNVPIIVGCSTSIGTIFLPLSTWHLLKLVERRKDMKQKQKYFKRNGGLLLQQRFSTDEGNVERLKLFTSNELTNATDYYNENRILGQGGQGIVYKGMLTDGRQKPISSGQSEEVAISLVNFFLQSMKENSLLNIVDPLVRNDGPEEKIVAIAKLAKRCLNLNGKKRPTMRQVALELGWIRSSEEANVIQQSADEDSDTDEMIEVPGIASCSTSGSILNNSVTLALDASL
ncbi:hypothetical protein V6N13_054845 [Hibiscus sabdariffa]